MTELSLAASRNWLIVLGFMLSTGAYTRADINAALCKATTAYAANISAPFDRGLATHLLRHLWGTRCASAWRPTYGGGSGGAKRGRRVSHRRRK